jgi:hypothetical protein
VDRRLARRNIRAGLLIGGLAVFFFGLTFLFTSFYIS